jgi:hypothetical protein
MDTAGQFEILQLKEKFGGLRIHVNHANDSIRERIETAIRDSLCTREVYGLSGRLREDRWIKMLCDKHASEYGRRDG